MKRERKGENEEGQTSYRVQNIGFQLPPADYCHVLASEDNCLLQSVSFAQKECVFCSADVWVHLGEISLLTTGDTPFNSLMNLRRVLKLKMISLTQNGVSQ